MQQNPQSRTVEMGVTRPSTMPVDHRAGIISVGSIKPSGINPPTNNLVNPVLSNPPRGNVN